MKTTNCMRHWVIIPVASFLLVSVGLAQIEFTQVTFAADYGNAVYMYGVDLDLDGDTDILLSSRGNMEIAWFENDGEQDFTGHTIQDNYVQPFRVCAADLDSDGDLDVVAAGAGTNDNVSWWENDGDMNWEAHSLIDNWDNAQYVWTEDLDQDNDIDILGAAILADEIIWWENEGNREFTEHTLVDMYDGAICVSTGDMDDDGDIDIVTAARDADVISWFENDGDEDFEEHEITNTFDHVIETFIADMDSDGDLDIVGGAANANEFAWWENDDLDFIEHTVDNNFTNAKNPYAVDFDWDGDMDFVASGTTGDLVAWFENDGEQDFTRRTIVAYDGPRGVHAADIDGDGDLDVLAAAVIETDLDWWENDLDPQPDATLDGTVTDGETGEAVEEAAVRAGASRDTTDVNGYYFLDNILSGERTFVVSHPNYSRRVIEIEVNVGENTLDVELYPLSTVSGTVVDIDTGDPVADADVRFGGDETTTNEDGYWEVPPQEQGDHTISITADHYYVFTEVIEVEPGDNEFDVELVPLATISGTISDSETGVGVEDADIIFGDFEYLAISDENGEYLIEDVQAGEYDVLIITEGYFDYEEEDVIVEERENVLDFEIDILSGSLTGFVSDELTEEMLNGATVTVIDPETQEIYREVTTDEFGEYEAEGLHDGVRYRVFAELDGYARSDTESVTIGWDRDNEQDFELTPIFARGIQQLQTEQELETWVTTTGIVTQGTNTTDTEHTDIYIQDGSGWGIQVYSDDPTDQENNINRGDEINVTGYLIEEDEITRIANFEIEVIGTGNDLPDPLIESTGDMSQLVEREGTWAQITGMINRTPPGEDDYSLIVDDGSGQCNVRINESTGIDLTDMVEGDWGQFSGVISLSRQGLRIIPNIQVDVEQLAIFPPTDLQVEYYEGGGDSLSLEVTLSWSHDYLDDWLRFKIYRDEAHVSNTQELTWGEEIVIENPEETYDWIYYITAVYDEGETVPSNEVHVFWPVQDVPDRPYSGIPTEWALEAVYPNPFNPLLSIIVALPEQTELTVKVFNILGEEVALLANNVHPPGYRKFTFDAGNLTSGIYFVNAVAPGKLNEVRKIVLMK
ncbi:carboxypeptidase regulatory-like domain-containing protein [Calditrichota bacterium]